LDAYAKAGKALEAQAIIDRIEELYRLDPINNVKPEKRCYTCVISAWSRSRGGNYAGKMADGILTKLENMYEETSDEDLRPNVRSYFSVIEAWSRAANPRAAKNILLKMKQKSKSSVFTRENWEDDIRPNRFCYTSVIQGYARVPRVGMAVEGYKLYQMMINDYKDGVAAAKPDAHVYSALINLCASVGRIEGISREIHSRERRHALTMAFDILDELRSQSHSYVKPNCRVYGCIIKACRYLSQDRKEMKHLLEIVWKKCCEDGLVSDAIFEQMQWACNGIFLEEILKDRDVVSVFSLPVEWRRNVKRNVY